MGDGKTRLTASVFSTGARKRMAVHCSGVDDRRGFRAEKFAGRSRYLAPSV